MGRSRRRQALRDLKMQSPAVDWPVLGAGQSSTNGPSVPLRSCGTCGTITQNHCPKGHALCSQCKAELDVCETCLEGEADQVRFGA